MDSDFRKGKNTCMFSAANALLDDVRVSMETGYPTTDLIEAGRLFVQESGVAPAAPPPSIARLKMKRGNGVKKPVVPAAPVKPAAASTSMVHAPTPKPQAAPQRSAPASHSEIGAVSKMGRAKAPARPQLGGSGSHSEKELAAKLGLGAALKTGSGSSRSGVHSVPQGQRQQAHAPQAAPQGGHAPAPAPGASPKPPKSHEPDDAPDNGSAFGKSRAARRSGSDTDHGTAAAAHFKQSAEYGRMAGDAAKRGDKVHAARLANHAYGHSIAAVGHSGKSNLSKGAQKKLHAHVGLAQALSKKHGGHSYMKIKDYASAANG